MSARYGWAWYGAGLWARSRTGTEHLSLGPGSCQNTILRQTNAKCYQHSDDCQGCKRRYMNIAFMIIKSIWAATWQNQQNECAPSEDSDQPGHPHYIVSNSMSIATWRNSIVNIKRNVKGRDHQTFFSIAIESRYCQMFIAWLFIQNIPVT